jgi:hypothetical protein
MHFLLVLACNNGCSNSPSDASFDTGVVPTTDDTAFVKLDTASLDHDDVDLYRGEWTVPEPATVFSTLDDLPEASDGDGKELMVAPEGEFVIRTERRNAQTAAAGCASLFMACWDPLNRSAAACLANVPTCQTDTPWDEEAWCCHASCGDRYAELRAQGLRVTDAVPVALFQQNSCMPGINEMLEGDR